MRNCFASLAIAIVLTLGWAGSSHAAPMVDFMVDGNSVTQVAASEAGDGTYFIENWSWSNGEVSVDDLNIFFDPDPIISFSGAVTDFGGASTFGFIFSQAIVPTAAPGVVRATFQSGGTDVGGGGISITPVVPPAGIPVDSDAITELMVYNLSQDGGANWLNAELDLGIAASLPAGQSGSFGSFNPASIAGPAVGGNYDFMRVDVGFTGTGGADTYTFSGLAEVIVPEPAAFGLLGLGLAALALRRRQSS